MGARYSRAGRRQIRVPWGVHTEIACVRLVDPWKPSVQDHTESKVETQSTMQAATFHARRQDWRVFVSTSLKPAVMSRKRVKKQHLGFCRDLTSWQRVRQATKVLRPGRELHWLGYTRPLERVVSEGPWSGPVPVSWKVVFRRIMIQKEAGESYEGTPGLSRITPLAVFRELGWYPKDTMK